MLAEHGGVDVWNYTSAEGTRRLKAALDFVLPYAMCERPWPYQEETPFDHGKLFEVLRIAARKWHDDAYELAIRRLNCTAGSVVDYSGSFVNLVWPHQLTDRPEFTAAS